LPYRPKFIREQYGFSLYAPTSKLDVHVRTNAAQQIRVNS